MRVLEGRKKKRERISVYLFKNAVEYEVHPAKNSSKAW